MAGWVILGVLLMVVSYVRAQGLAGRYYVSTAESLGIMVPWWIGVLAVANGALGMILQ